MSAKTFANILLTLLVLWIVFFVLVPHYEMWKAAGYAFGPLFPQPMPAP